MTPLGHLLQMSPMDAAHARLLLNGVRYGDALLACQLAAVLKCKAASVFLTGMDPAWEVGKMVGWADGDLSPFVKTKVKVKVEIRIKMKR